MTLKINQDSMTVEVNGSTIAMAARSGERWIVSTWPRTLKYNQAITALTLTERLAAGHGDDDPFVVAWREELAHG